MRFVAADWSGALRPTTLWVAQVDDSGRVVQLAPASRDGATDLLLDLASDDDVVAGLDFGFSLPAWWLRECGFDTAPALWDEPDRLESWLAACPPPFWGRPGRRRPPGPADSGYRRTELAVRPRPRSTFQIGGAGAVGTASLRGMPCLARLRAGGYAVWPFDRWRAPVVAEVWPRLSIGRTVKSSPADRAAWVERHRDGFTPATALAAAGSPDALDAAAAALGLARRGGATRPDPEDPVVRELEGWIDGVPLPEIKMPARMPMGVG